MDRGLYFSRKEIPAIFFFNCKTNMFMALHRRLIDKGVWQVIPSTHPSHFIKSFIADPGRSYQI
jgi:hypothetical protein